MFQQLLTHDEQLPHLHFSVAMDGFTQRYKILERPDSHEARPYIHVCHTEHGCGGFAFLFCVDCLSQLWKDKVTTEINTLYVKTLIIAGS